MRMIIYKPARTAMQSGRGRLHDWLIEPDTVTPRKPEPLMGWSTAGDTLSTLRGRLRFPTQEDAVSFARHKGWDFIITASAERTVVPRSYLDNFRIMRPEDEGCTTAGKT